MLEIVYRKVRVYAALREKLQILVCFFFFFSRMNFSFLVFVEIASNMLNYIFLKRYLIVIYVIKTLMLYTINPPVFSIL